MRYEHMFERHYLDFLNLFTWASSHLTDVGIIVYENLSFYAWTQVLNTRTYIRVYVCHNKVIAP